MGIYEQTSDFCALKTDKKSKILQLTGNMWTWYTYWIPDYVSIASSLHSSFWLLFAAVYLWHLSVRISLCAFDADSVTGQYFSMAAKVYGLFPISCKPSPCKHFFMEITRMHTGFFAQYCIISFTHSLCMYPTWTPFVRASTLLPRFHLRAHQMFLSSTVTGYTVFTWIKGDSFFTNFSFQQNTYIQISHVLCQCLRA